MLLVLSKIKHERERKSNHLLKIAILHKAYKHYNIYSAFFPIIVFLTQNRI
jgi:hypothetical protein